MPKTNRDVRRFTLPLAAVALAGAVALTACAKNPLQNLGDDATRGQVIEAVLGNPTAHAAIVDRLLGAPPDRTAIIGKLLADDAAKTEIAKQLLADDRGRAIVANAVVADEAGAKTFIRMLMTTGVMGASLSQQQADALGYGEAYTFGNRRRTMADLKKIGAVIDSWGRSHEGKYPSCAGLADLKTCLGKTLPAESLASAHPTDAWGAPFLYGTNRDATEYVLLSLATDGVPDGLGKVGPTDSIDCDIVFSNGRFVQWPGSFRLQDIP
ncbi:MAG TPA: type II secretion system protein GspG [Candidatus Polarisedimenticolia bacterium]|nr:type II secretion system protein GspG [Candidatus Polarisedimenticolia bacterium]